MKKSLAALLLFFPVFTWAEGPPQTLMELAGAHAAPGRLSDSVLVIIDAQQEYVNGALPLAGVDDALTQAARLLSRARAAGTPVVHIVHRGNDKLFNPAGPYVAIAAPLAPRPGETVIEKRLPNAFTGTGLQQVLAASGRKQLIIVGFMTHMCVSATTRAALDHGFATTVVASATATRALPDGHGGTLPATLVQRVSLAALADRFATVVDGANDIPE